jgi:peptide/nickel transport system substrate-binding protein/oligopeptide transport system substrate-binding protein
MRRLAFSLLLFLLLAACTGASREATAPAPDQLVRLSDAEIKGIDPQQQSDLASLRVAADQFEGLTRFDGRGEVIPGLASDWRTSGDGRVWTFSLRPKIRFSDGHAIDAALFVRLFDRLSDPKTASPHGALFAIIADIAAPSPDTVRVTLTAPFPQLPALLAHPAMAALPLHRIAQAQDDWTGERPLVTSGPYRLTDWRLGDHLRLERNPRWHHGAAPIDTVIWRPMEDSLAAMRLFLSGGADIASDYPASRHDWLRSNAPAAVRSGPFLGSYYFAFNTRRLPFADARVRMALAMSVEREWIAGQLLGMGLTPAWGLLPPGLAELPAFRPIWADWPKSRRLAEARALLRAAGYGPANPLRFEIRFNSSAEHRRVAAAMLAMWAPLGVEATLFNSEAALHFAALRQGDFALARSGWIADLPAPENFLNVHLPNNGSGNYSGYASARYAQLLGRAQRIADPAARAAAMRAAEAQIMADMPVLPLYHYVSRALVSPRIAGWNDNSSNVHPSATMRIASP